MQHIPLKDRINVIFEDPSLIIINKGSGILSQPAPNNKTGSAVELIRHYWRAKKLAQSYIGVVHRLDKETSGVMVYAKNKITHRLLQQQFAQHKVGKRYVAVVQNIPRQNKGRLTGSISHGNSGKRTVRKNSNTGKEAATRYTVLETFEKEAFLELAPETGRTHQIRIQLAAICCPIVGDTLYGPDVVKQREYRCMLHASTLSFLHPDTRKRVTFTVELPNDMQQYIDSIRTKHPEKDS